MRAAVKAYEFLDKVLVLGELEPASGWSGKIKITLKREKNDGAWKKPRTGAA